MASYDEDYIAAIEAGCDHEEATARAQEQQDAAQELHEELVIEAFLDDYDA